MGLAYFQKESPPIDGVEIGAATTVTFTLVDPLPEETFAWVEPAGGAYSNPDNWDPDACAPPRHDGLRRDTAVFPFSGPNAISVDASGAEALRWEVFGVYDTSGDAQVFGTELERPSLSVAGQGHLRHIGGTLRSVNTTVGTFGGTTGSQLDIANAATQWINVGVVQVGAASPGRVEITDAEMNADQILLGGSSPDSDGLLNLQGTAICAAAGIQVGSAQASGELNIGSGARFSTTDLSTLEGGPNRIGVARIGGVTVNGASTWEHEDVLEVAPTGRADVIVEDGGSLSVKHLKIGKEAGSSGSVLVKGVNQSQSGTKQSLLRTDLDVLVGHGEGAGLLEIRDGAGVVCDRVEMGCNGTGSVTVAGLRSGGSLSDISHFAALDAESELVVGCATGEGKGTLTLNKGGGAQSATVSVPGSGAGGRGQIIVDGQGGTAILTATKVLNVDAMEIVEVEVKNGGVVQAHRLVPGDSAVRPGAAQMTLRSSGSLGPTKLIIIDDPIGVPAQQTVVGDRAEGELNVFDGAAAELRGGLLIGGGARGTVVVSQPADFGTKLTVRGETLVGSAVGQEGFLKVEGGARMVCEGDLKIATEVPGDSTAVTIKGPTFTADKNLDVNGTLALGRQPSGLVETPSSGDMSLARLAIAECDLLLVGGGQFANGHLRVLDGSLLVVRGNAQIGAAGGNGKVLVGALAALNMVSGTMTVGGPGGDEVTVHGFISGAGLVKAVPGGVVNGSGRIQARKVESGGTIAPNLSPGTLTIEGDYEQLEGGVLEIEVAGLEPGQFDVLHITGNATLAGTVDLRFIDGFVPKPGDSIDFVVVDGTITGKLTGGTLVDVPGDPQDGAPDSPPPPPVAQAEVRWEVTPEGTCRLTVTNVTLLDESGRPLPECGAGLCGAGVVPMVPVTLLGLATWKASRRRRVR